MGLFGFFGKRANSKKFALFFPFGPKHPMAKRKQQKQIAKGNSKKIALFFPFGPKHPMAKRRKEV
jgi:hypothetical protein